MEIRIETVEESTPCTSPLPATDPINEQLGIGETNNYPGTPEVNV